MSASDDLEALIGRLREALEEQLLGGQHEGPCDNEDSFEPGPCSIHVAAARKRDDAARDLLDEFAQGSTFVTLERITAVAVAAEREACAKIADNATWRCEHSSGPVDYPIEFRRLIAEAIRARHT